MATPSSQEQNVKIVLDAFDTLFNKRDYASAMRFWSPRYIQHSAHIPPGREGLFELVKALPATLRYENQLAAATGDFVILPGRLSGLGPTPAGGGGDSGRGRELRHSPRPVQRSRPDTGVGGGRHRAHAGWRAHGTLGRNTGRGHTG